MFVWYVQWVRWRERHGVLVHERTIVTYRTEAEARARAARIARRYGVEAEVWVAPSWAQCCGA